MGFLVETAAVCWCVRGDALVACVRALVIRSETARGIAADEKHAAKGKKRAALGIEPRTSRNPLGDPKRESYY